MHKLRAFVLFFLIVLVGSAAAQNFRVPILVDDGNYSITLTIGVDPNGSDGYDPGLDIYAPPPPPPGAFDARLSWAGEDYFTDIRDNSIVQKTFVAKYAAASGFGPITLYWDSAALAALGTFEIVDNITGTLFGPVDMTTVDSLVVASSNPFIQTGLRILMTPSAQVNHPPMVVSPIPDQTQPMDFTTYTVASLDTVFSDQDGDTLSFSVATDGNTTAALNGSMLELSSTAGFTGTSMVYVSAADSEFTVSDTFQVTVLPPGNNPPFVANPIPDQQKGVDFPTYTAANLDTVFDDPDNDPLTYTAATDGNTTANVNGTLLELSSITGYSGNSQVIVTADDGNTMVSDTFMVVISAVTNDPPVVQNPIADQQKLVDFQTYVVAMLDMVFSDPNGDTLTYTASSDGNTQPSIIGDTLKLSSVAGYEGPSQVIVTADDGQYSVSDTFMVEVFPANWAPDFDLPINVTDGNYSVMLKIGVDPNGTDGYDPGLDLYAPPPPPPGAFDARLIGPDNDNYFFDIRNNSLEMKIFRMRYVPADTWGPIVLRWDTTGLSQKADLQIVDDITGSLFGPVDMNAVDSLEVTDTFILSGLRIRMMPHPLPPNDPPSVDNPIADQLKLVDFTTYIAANLNQVFSDPEGQALSFTASSDGGTTVNVLDDSLLEIASVSGFIGNSEVIVSATDGLNTTSDTFLVKVFPASAAPNFDVPIYVTDGNYDIWLKVGVDPNGTDGYDPGLDLYAPPPPPPGAFDARLIGPDNDNYFYDIRGNSLDLKVFRMRYVPADNWGPIVLHWDSGRLANLADMQIVDDVTGNLFGPVDMTMTDSLVVTDPLILAGLRILMTPYPDTTNDVPVAVNDTVMTDEDMPVNISVLMNDYDPEGDTLKVISVTQPASGSAVINPGDTTVTYSPDPDFFGMDQFRYVVTDGNSNDTAMVFVTVQSVNDPPTISNLPDSVVFREDSSAMLDIWNYVDDVESPDSALTYGFGASNDSLQRSFDPATGMLTLSATPGFHGEVFLYITATDPDNGIASDTLLVVVSPIVGIYDPYSGIPASFVVQQNYPNPFNPATTIRFGIPQPAEVRITIFNSLGQKVRTLLTQRKAAGYYSVQWDGRNDYGTTVGSGLYFFEVRADKYRTLKKMMLLK
ncbi:MAG: Ig-like domain-containing protein [Calditrichia bacterium]